MSNTVLIVQHKRRTFQQQRIFAVGALWMTLAMLVAACASPSTTGPAGTSTGAASETPKKGGVVRIVQSADIAPVSIMAQNNPNFSFMRLVFNTLTEYDHKTLKPAPSLATSWKVAADNTSITFQLRQGVKYHDGRAFTADDVIASLQVVQRPTTPSQMKHNALLITKMTKNGDHEVTLTLEHAVSNLFDLFELLPIIDVNTVDGLFGGTTFNGTGPFKVQTRTPGQGLKLVRNDSYWKPGLPHLDGVDITVVRDSQSMLSSLRAGQSDLALDLAPLDAASVRNDPNFSLVLSDAYDFNSYILSNVTVPLLAKKEVRQAISFAIDRERILKQALGGIGTTTSLPWAPQSPAYDKTKVNYFKYDPAKARSMLQSQGVLGQKIELNYNAGFAPDLGVVEIVQFNLKEAGLDVVVVPHQSSQFFAKLNSGQHQGLSVTGHGLTQLHPVSLIKGAFGYNADKNASLFDNQQYKDLAAALWKETDPAKQKPLMDKVNDFLLDQQFVSDLVSTTHTYTISSKLRGLYWTMWSHIDLENAYLR